MEYNYAVFIGRFQPLHNGHLSVILQALREAKQLIVVIGSSPSARNIKNPWSFDERVLMIRACLQDSDFNRIHFVSSRDYHYNDNHWVTEIQQRVNYVTGGDSNVCLVGSYKDASSHYIKLFPQWEFVPAKNNQQMDATDVRNKLFGMSCTKTWGDKGDMAQFSQPVWDDFLKYADTMLPNEITNMLIQYVHTPAYLDMKEEYDYIQKYKEQWNNVPFPVTFNTVDAVVVQSGHILVVKRKYNPGKGLYALPGGFLKQTERLEAGAIRELKEETGIRVPAPVLSSHVVDHRTFDYPARSLRGRTITTAFYIKLPDGELPDVKGSDDAEKAIWMPLMDVVAMEDKFFEDHAHIIRYFVNRS